MGVRATISRMARWRARLVVGLAETTISGLRSRRARWSPRCACRRRHRRARGTGRAARPPSAMTTCPRPGQRGRRRPHLGHHALADGAAGDERLDLGRAEGGDALAVAAQHPVRVGQQDQPLRAQPARQAGSHVVGVDVAHDAHLVERERRHDRHPAIDEQRVDERSADIDDGRDQALVRRPFGDQQAAVDPATARPHRRRRRAARPRAAVLIGAAQDRGDDLDGRLVGDAQAVLEARRHAHARQPLRDRRRPHGPRPPAVGGRRRRSPRGPPPAPATVVPPSLTTTQRAHVE